jgi:hypothetical protein
LEYLGIAKNLPDTQKEQDRTMSFFTDTFDLLDVTLRTLCFIFFSGPWV